MKLNNLIYLFQIVVRGVSYLKNRNFNEKEFIKKYITKNSTIIDIGSNVGTYIKFISKINKNIPLNIYSIEPISELCETQRKMNLAKNHNLYVSNLVITDNDEKEVIFYENIISSHSTSLKNENNNKLKKSYVIKAMNLNDYLLENKIDSVDLLKIDTEGMDFRILKSLDRILEKNIIKAIKVEIFSENIEIIHYLLKYGYRLVNFNNISIQNNEISLFDGYFVKP
jgi:FkbM family methyltransferase